VVFQLGVTIFAGTFIGSRLDKRFGNERPYFTLLLSFFAFAAGFYLAFKALIIKK